MDELHRSRRILAILLSGVISVALAASALASVDGQAAADEVSEASYRYFLGDDQGVPGILFARAGDSRDLGGADHDAAQANIVAEFQSFGLVVTLEPFSYSGDTYHNIVATKIGTIAPDQEYIIGSHYDSTCFCANAPGADDNASGVATVLEAARIISQYDSDYTIRFICFGREEQGLIGSNAYVASHSGDDILGMVQCDMMAWNPGPTNNASIWGRDVPALPLKNALAQAITLYSEYQGVSLTPIDQGWNGQSDHAPFDAAGYQACMFIESQGFSNSTIHSSADNVDNPGYINYPYATRMTKSVVGWLVDAAGVRLDGLVFRYPNGHPGTVSPGGGELLRVEVAGAGGVTPQPGTGVFHYDIGAGWQSGPMTVIAPNVYDAVFPATNCGQEIKYYVSAEDVVTNLFTSPGDAPATSFSAVAIGGLTEDVIFEENLDVSPGWTVEGQWAFGGPTGGGGQYGGPDPGVGQVHTGTNVYGYNLAGDYPNNLPETHLTSSAIDCTDTYGVRLQFWRWLGVEQPIYDHAYVRVSNNGTDWTTVWQNSVEIADNSWQQMDLDISAVADNQSTVYLRWTMGATDGGWRYCGWNIDDITLTAIDCAAQCLGADGDMNGVDGTNGDDIQFFVNALLGVPTAYEICHGNFDGLNDLDANDIPGMVAKLLE